VFVFYFFFISDEQNVVAVQYRGEIYYRVSKDIQAGEEFLTYYGDGYFYEMGGDPKKFHTNVPDQAEDVIVSFSKTQNQHFCE
jgi:hypothetical protein